MSDAMESLLQSVATAEKLKTKSNDELADIIEEHVWADFEMCSAQSVLLGEVMDRLRGLKTCASCHGWGYVEHVRCAICDGTGDVEPRARETDGAVREAAERLARHVLDVPMSMRGMGTVPHAEAIKREGLAVDLLHALSSPPRPDFIRCALPRGECCHQRIPPVLPLEAPECNDGDDCCRYCGRGLQPCGACKPPAPPADAATEAVREAALHAVATMRGGASHLLAMSTGAHHCPGCGLIHAEWIEAALKLEGALSTPAPAPSAKEGRT